MLPLYKSKLLALPHIKHGFFTRQGGVSSHNYASLNLGHHVGDNEENVGKNKQLIGSYFSAPLVILNQIHSNKVIHITEANYNHKFTGDALVANTPNLVLSILTADCCPILIADFEQSIIGAVHAGWRSACSGIIQNTVELMRSLGAKQLYAAIGPSISKANYEVDKNFKNNEKDIEKFLHSDGQKILFDLPAYNLHQLAALGVEAEQLNLCTYELTEEFFSFRRSQGQNCGRQISAIMLQKRY